MRRQTIAQVDSGKRAKAELGATEMGATEDMLTRLAIKDQADSGLDLVTDGQIRWYDPISHVAGKLTNVAINGSLRFFDTNLYIRQPVIRGPFAWAVPVLRPEFEMARAASSRPVKPVMTGALTIARHSLVLDPHYQKDFARLVKDYNEALVCEVRELAIAGATVIQIDEPAILKDRQPNDLRIMAACWRRLASAKGSAKLVLNVFLGDPGPILGDLLALPADVLALDFTCRPKLVDQVAAARPAKPLGLGLLDGGNAILEETAAVAESLAKILPNVRAAECYLSPSAGLGSLPRDHALAKLKHLVAIRNSFRG